MKRGTTALAFQFALHRTPALAVLVAMSQPPTFGNRKRNRRRKALRLAAKARAA